MSDDAMDMLCDESWQAVGALLADLMAPPQADELPAEAEPNAN